MSANQTKSEEESVSLIFQKYFLPLLKAKIVLKRAEEEAADLTNKLAAESAVMANLTAVANQTKAEDEAVFLTIKKE